MRRPLFPRREIGFAIGELRMAHETLEWFGANALGLVAPVPDEKAQTLDWERWLSHHMTMLPPELLPPVEHLIERCLMLEAIAPWPTPTRREGRRTKRVQFGSIDCAYLPLRFLAEELKLRIPSVARVEEMFESKQRNDMLLWAMAWRSAFTIRIKTVDAILRSIWKFEGASWAPRLNIEEVWVARRRLIERLA